MKSLAFFNNKGGVGKTTLLCNVAAYFAQEFGASVCIADADPQCNATQYLLDDDTVTSLYNDPTAFTVFSIVEPLSYGEGYSADIQVIRSPRFGVDILAGDPRLALTEDLLARDWGDAKAGEIRGIRTSLVFAELLSRLTHYDYVFFDVSPSLGAINRSILLSSEYFISPVSIDIFSLLAFENISRWIDEWWSEWERGVASVRDKSRIPALKFGRSQFLGYVTQQYLAKKDASGQRRAVQAYEDIRLRMNEVIQGHVLQGDLIGSDPEIGTVPNLFSLVPMSQSSHAPIFRLTASDGIVGAHFAKVKDSKDIFGKVSDQIRARMSND